MEIRKLNTDNKFIVIEKLIEDLIKIREDFKNKQENYVGLKTDSQYISYNFLIEFINNLIKELN